MLTFHCRCKRINQHKNRRAGRGVMFKRPLCFVSTVCHDLNVKQKKPFVLETVSDVSGHQRGNRRRAHAVFPPSRLQPSLEQTAQLINILHVDVLENVFNKETSVLCCRGDEGVVSAVVFRRFSVRQPVVTNTCSILTLESRVCEENNKKSNFFLFL